MFHRTLAAVLALCVLAAPALAEQKPYRVSLAGDGYVDGEWHTGILIELDQGWKTYWRMPGEAGIPPEFTWKSSVPANIAVLYPAPARYVDQSGETVGYEHEVLLPVKVDAGKAGAVKLDLDLFFAVCKDICIPAQASASIDLTSTTRDPANAARDEAALARVPVPGSLVTSARIAESNGKLELELALKEPVDDIFVETPASAYFAAPAFSADGLMARLPIANVRDVAKLEGMALRLTYLKHGGGLEQSLTLP